MKLVSVVTEASEADEAYSSAGKTYETNIEYIGPIRHIGP